MVMSEKASSCSRTTGAAPSRPGSSQDGLPDAASREVTWHDLECGAYRADLALWRELGQVACAGALRSRILDVGAGTGRVTLDLARAGHGVTALELRPALLGALASRAAELDVQTERADARDFELRRNDFGLCIVPMNTIQLLDGPAARIAFLGRARAHLRAGGLLACAIITAPEPFDCASGDPEPSPETVRAGSFLYVSRTRRVSVLEQTILIERERQIVSLGKAAKATESGSRSPPPRAWRGGGSVEMHPAEREVIRLDRLRVSDLEREGIEAGLRVEPSRRVAPTDEHAGSAVVMLRA
jgi:SAM-dependent methyltransferase